MAYSNEIANIRKARGISQSELAEKIGSTLSMLGKLERGDRRLNQDWMARIAEALEVEPYQLIAPMEDDLPEPAKPIPVLGEVPAGNWREAVKNSRMSIPSPDPSMPRDAYALRVCGDSMNLLVEEGGMIVVDPTDKALFPGRYYVVRRSDGDVTFKQYQEGPARLVPCSTNTEHQDMALGQDEVMIVGRIIWRAARM